MVPYQFLRAARNALRQVSYLLRKLHLLSHSIFKRFQSASPGLLKTLQDSDEPVPLKLDKKAAQSLGEEKISMDEKIFRWMLNEDAMATEKLAEGIRNFTKDTLKLETFVRELCRNC